MASEIINDSKVPAIRLNHVAKFGTDEEFEDYLKSDFQFNLYDIDYVVGLCIRNKKKLEILLNNRQLSSRLYMKIGLSSYQNLELIAEIIPENLPNIVDLINTNIEYDAACILKIFSLYLTHTGDKMFKIKSKYYNWNILWAIIVCPFLTNNDLIVLFEFFEENDILEFLCTNVYNGYNIATVWGSTALYFDKKRAFILKRKKLVMNYLSDVDVLTKLHDVIQNSMKLLNELLEI